MHQKEYSFDNIDRIKDIRWLSILNWGVSSFVAFLTTTQPLGIGAFRLTGASGLDSFVVAFILQILINKVFKQESILTEVR